MQELKMSIAKGHAQFTSAEWQGFAQAHGQDAAWLLAFSQAGSNAPELAQGNFAAAVRMDDGGVFMAVDRFAVNTLCYRIQGDTLLFSERADELADASTPIDPQALFDYLYFHVIPSPRTIFKGVFRLPPGHSAMWRDGKLTVAPYWIPSFEPPQGPVSFDSLQREFRSLLSAGVQAQLDGGKPGCFLSGGTGALRHRALPGGLSKRLSACAPLPPAPSCQRRLASRLCLSTREAGPQPPLG